MKPNEFCDCRYADVGCDKMEQVMDQISGKWKLRILFMVGAHGTLRYGELKKLLGRVTDKMLSAQLKELAADGLILRRDYGEVPPRVEYELTDRGQALMPVFDDIQRYIKQYLV
ncbi:MAG: winged helix-turn-helix transcriptional regulator [Gemmiger sp.]